MIAPRHVLRRWCEGQIASGATVGMEVSLPVGDLLKLLNEVDRCCAATHCTCHDANDECIACGRDKDPEVPSDYCVECEPPKEFHGCGAHDLPPGHRWCDCCHHDAPIPKEKENGEDDPSGL